MYIYIYIYILFETNDEIVNIVPYTMSTCLMDILYVPSADNYDDAQRTLIVFLAYSQDVDRAGVRIRFVIRVNLGLDLGWSSG